ncbi:hypothetical protein DER46DRAFT_680714 [Fusarium sp. MPI-SDFR-AT-0072]|nr:hypothetical protein DER46DRAFT_680714 [Fusarium sp. MPI-SDFR-AT-0072]
MRAKLGSSLPPGDKHVRTLDHITKSHYTDRAQQGVSVYIPTWEDTVAWAKRDPELIAQLKTGYPRFFVPLVVNELAERLLTWTSELPSRFLTREFRDDVRQSLKERGRSAMLVTACQYAKDLQGYLERQRMRASVFVVDFDGNIRPVKKAENGSDLNKIYVVVYPQQGEKEAKAFWQHTGYDSLSTKDNKLKKKSDVLLYPTGMSAISHIHDIISLYTTTTKRTIAIFGFLYVGTFKVLEYDFLFVVDDTVGTSVNVDVISHCDVWELQRHGRKRGPEPKRRSPLGYKETIKGSLYQHQLSAGYDCNGEKQRRFRRASYQSQSKCRTYRRYTSQAQFGWASLLSQGKPETNVQKVYGYLLSIRFKTLAAAIGFHDALDVAKGPSLGTNFTLGCAYTLFAHYHELEWAEEYGVVEHLVRISVGIENERFLEEVIKAALDAAEQASRTSVTDLATDVSSCVTLTLAYVRLIEMSPMTNTNSSPAAPST